MKKMPRKSKGLTVSEAATLPTREGTWQVVAFYDADAKRDGDTHVILYMGELLGAKQLPVRVQSECLTGEVFGSLKCDCDDQLHLAMRTIRKRGKGAVIYLRQEGRGVGIFNKIRAYHLQDHGFDTVEANKKLGLPEDARDYHAAAAILKKLGVQSIQLMTNNPLKVSGLKKEGIVVSGRMPLRAKPGKFNRDYLKTKRDKMKHDL